MWEEAVCRHFVSSNGRQNASFGCHICHFISFYTDVTWNPTQCDVFTSISQLSVKFQYVENCHIVNIKAEQVLHRRPELESSHLRAMDIDTTPSQLVTSTTMLPEPCVQTPTSGMEPMVTKSSYPQRPVQIPTLLLDFSL